MQSVKIDNRFSIGDFAYLVTDPDQKKRIVTSIQILEKSLMYRVVFETHETWHYEFELSHDRNIILATGG